MILTSLIFLTDPVAPTTTAEHTCINCSHGPPCPPATPGPLLTAVVSSPDPSHPTASDSALTTLQTNATTYTSAAPLEESATCGAKYSICCLSRVNVYLSSFLIILHYRHYTWIFTELALLIVIFWFLFLLFFLFSTFPQPPAPPQLTQLFSSNITGTSFCLYWSSRSPSNQTRYLVDIRNGSDVISHQNTSDNTLHVTGLDPGVLYSVIVTPCACDTQGESLQVNVKTGMIVNVNYRLIALQQGLRPRAKEKYH